MEPVYEVRSLVLVEVGDHLRVAAGRERVPGALQAGAQLAVVVDLAVEDDRDGSILVEDRLIAGRQVDDAQTLDPKPYAGVDVKASRVWAAVLERITHALEHRTLGRPAVTPCLSDDPAHGGVPVGGAGV